MIFINLWFVITISYSLSVLAEKEDEFVVALTPEAFDDALKTSNHFVMFYAPWCGHCKRLHPLWDQIAEMMNVDDPQVVIAKVDCTQHQDLCALHEITGYPTLKFFKTGFSESTKFRGSRDLPTITEFIEEQIGKKVKDDDSDSSVPVHKLIELTDDTFNEHVSAGKHFIKFYAPWCSHCQRLAPTWEELSKSFESDRSIKIAKIDCTVYRPICQDFEVKGYPTLLWIENGKKIEKYSGGRSHDDLTSYVQNMLGTGPIMTTEHVQDNDTKTINNDKVYLLNSKNFQENIEIGVTFIKFYAPWCGHCQKLSPVWDQLAAKIHNEISGIKIAKVDCTLPDNKQLCVEQQIEGYPTLLIYRNSEKLNEYNGNRQLDDLYKFVANSVAHDEL